MICAVGNAAAVKAAAGTTAHRWYRTISRYTAAVAGPWDRIAEGILYSEGRVAATAYQSRGEWAAIESVDDGLWATYLGRLWTSVTPEAGLLATEFHATEQAKAAPQDPYVLGARVWLRTNGLREAGNISNTSRRGIADQIRIGLEKGESDAQIAARITKHYRTIGPSRAQTIARNEVHAASNFGTLTAIRQAQELLLKVWTSMGDDDVRDSHQDAEGQTRQIEDAFSIHGERLMFPGDSSLGASAAETVNCRCVLGIARMSRIIRPRRPRRIRR